MTEGPPGNETAAPRFSRDGGNLDDNVLDEQVSGYPNGKGEASFGLDTPISLTIFKRIQADTKEELRLSLRQIGARVRATMKVGADDDIAKAKLPHFKLQTFGDLRTEKNCLRSDANVIAVSGLEIDHDDGTIPIEVARRLAQEADLLALFFTTASAGPRKHRWRALFPFSREMPPDERERLVERLNGLYGGALDQGASFTLSQPAYFGGVNGKRPRILFSEGRTIDRAEDLDAGAMPKQRTTPAGENSEPSEAGSFDEASALDAIMTGADYHRSMLSLGGLWAWQGVGYAEAVKRVEAAFDAVPEDQRDARWRERRATIAETLLYSYGREAAKPKEEEEEEPGVNANEEFADADVFDGEGLTDEERDLLGYPPRDGAKPSGGLGFEPVSSWGDTPPPRQWLVEGLIPHGDVTSLYGDGGTGKSLLAFQLAASTATGRKWIGKDVERRGAVLYLSAEDDRDELHRRALDICGATAGLDLLQAKPLVGEDATLAEPDRKTNALRPTPRYAALNSDIAAKKPTLVVLDTLADLHSGNQNDPMHGRQFIGLMRRLAFRHGCTIVLLAHPSKSGMSSGTGDAGTVAWNNSVRSRLYFSRVFDKDGEEEDTEVRALTVKKANYGPTGERVNLRWQRGVYINTEYFGDDDTAPRESREAKARRVFLKLLSESQVPGRYVSASKFGNYAPRLFAERKGSEGVSEKEFNKAMEALFAEGAIRMGTHKAGGQSRDHLEEAV